jgi:hypothetical protein
MSTGTVSDAFSANVFVILRGGLTVRVAAVDLLLSLEARGITLARDGEFLVLTENADRASEEDRQLIRWYKPHLLALIDYCEREARQ